MAAVTAEAQQRLMQLAADLEVEMMSDMYRRMANSCHKKCVVSSYKESDLSKAESVCLDRCVAKYMEVHERLGKKLTIMSQQDDAAIQQAAAGAAT